MPGPGMELIGSEEIEQVLEVLEGRHLSRYGRENDPNFKAKVYTLEQEVAQKFGEGYAIALNQGHRPFWSLLAD